jgi:DNA-binding IclR family transcriptional regulator
MPAFFPPDGVGSFVDAQVRRFTPKTITDLKSLNRELRKAREEWVAFFRSHLKGEMRLYFPNGDSLKRDGLRYFR